MISEFPVFTGKIEHAHTVYTRPSLSQREGPGDEASCGASLSCRMCGYLTTWCFFTVIMLMSCE